MDLNKRESYCQLKATTWPWVEVRKAFYEMCVLWLTEIFKTNILCFFFTIIIIIVSWGGDGGIAAVISHINN